MARFFWTNPALAVGEVEKIVQRAALEVTREAKVRAPVDTGVLQASITPTKDESSASRVTYLVGTRIHYAAYQEFGTRHIPAHPYLVPALFAVRGRYGGTVGL